MKSNKNLLEELLQIKREIDKIKNNPDQNDFETYYELIVLEERLKKLQEINQKESNNSTTWFTGLLGMFS